MSVSCPVSQPWSAGIPGLTLSTGTWVRHRARPRAARGLTLRFRAPDARVSPGARPVNGGYHAGHQAACEGSGGAMVVRVRPVVLLTSNSTRDLGDALKRRCLHLHIGFPDAKLEGRIIESRVPGVEASLRRELVAFVQQLRALDLKKLPSISETIDWARVLVLLHATALDTELVHSTLNVLLKFETDIEAANKQIATLAQRARQEATRPV